MNNTTIFITYNPNTALEETLAARLHTIGAVSGFTMYLPDRFNSENEISEESKVRISRSNYLVMFSTKSLSNIVKQEIEFAFNYLNDKSKIIVIYDKLKGKNLSGEITSHFTSFYFDEFENRQDKLLEKIINTISHKEKDKVIVQQSNKISTLKKQKDDSNALAALIGVGLGLLVLGAIFSKK
ncbi:MAG: hypothetical protein A2046_05270 [Bacteroidetes bacterium GWA2_30_7]|nr:MAG: hypothetical protein A2046_05270 [Bacteroidetes bacterium GWA2_30_7]